MPTPAGVTKGKKDNSKKRPYDREQWMKGKKIGRPKQVYNFGEGLPYGMGYWVKEKQ